MRLGIQHQRIRPASPQENDAHERVHKTWEGRGDPAAPRNLGAQQRASTIFRTEYNTQRTHSALGGDGLCLVGVKPAISRHGGFGARSAGRSDTPER